MTGLAVLHRGTSTPDGVLVQEAAAGSGVAYGALYDRYATQVFNYCLRLTGSPEDAGDATQEAFLNVLRRLQDDDRPVLEFSSYLFAAARHESYSLMRQRIRAQPSDRPPAERGRVADLETDPERSVLLRDSQEAVREANAKLPPRHREVLALREVAGRSYEEIGETMGISENAAAQLIWRARSKLREAMSAGAVASVVATSEECETAQFLLSRVQDGEAVDEADRIWLQEHLDECGSCKTANRLLLEVGASYRCWMPVALFAGMRTDTLTRAGEVVGADWSHVPTPGKGAAGSSGGVSAGAGTVAAVTAAVVAAAAIGGLALMRDDEAAAPADPVANQKPAASAPQPVEKTTPSRTRDAKPAPAGPRLVAARAAGSFAPPVLAAAPSDAPGPVNEAPTPEARNAPRESSPPQDRPEQLEDTPGQPPGDSPGQPPGDSTPPDPPILSEPPAEPPVVSEPTVETPTPPDSGVKPVPDPSANPELPVTPLPDPLCTFPGRGTGPDECPPGQGGDPPGNGKDPPGDGTTPPVRRP